MSILSSVGAGKRLVGIRVIDMFYALTKISDFIKEYYDYAPVDDAGVQNVSVIAYILRYN